MFRHVESDGFGSAQRCSILAAAEEMFGEVIDHLNHTQEDPHESHSAHDLCLGCHRDFGL